MGQCGITSSKTVLVFLNLIFWVSVASGREKARGRRCGPKRPRLKRRWGTGGDTGWVAAGAEEVGERRDPAAETREGLAPEAASLRSLRGRDEDSGCRGR